MKQVRKEIFSMSSNALSEQEENVIGRWAGSMMKWVHGIFIYFFFFRLCFLSIWVFVGSMLLFVCPWMREPISRFKLFSARWVIAFSIRKQTKRYFDRFRHRGPRSWRMTHTHTHAYSLSQRSHRTSQTIWQNIIYLFSHTCFINANEALTLF